MTFGISAMANRIRQWRKHRKMTLETLAAHLGTSAGHLHKWETGKVAVTADRLHEIAEVLECAMLDLVDGTKKVPVVGSVGERAAVLLMPADTPGQEPRQVRCPTGLDPKRTVAVAVDGDAMLPIDDGWLLFYTKSGDGVPVECLGKLCVVELADGRARYIRRVKLGRRPGVFNLYGSNAREIEDVTLSWAAPVLDARPPDQNGE